MKAIVYNQYGSPDRLEYTDVEKPTPTDNQVLVKVRAASINAREWRLFTMGPLMPRLMGGGLLKPKAIVLGRDIAGQVEAVGSQVTQFQPGDEVFGVANGGYAEYVCTSPANLARKPANVSFEAAAAVPVAAITALQGIRDTGQLQPGQTVLICGASGGVGTFAVQIAKAFGGDITAVCSTRNLGMARALGADHVIDYTREDFTKSGQRYDLILAVNGSHSLPTYRRALKPGGIFVGLGGSLAQIFQVMLLGRWVSRFGGQKMSIMVAHIDPKDLAHLGELLEAGKIVPVIDRQYPLQETVQAFRYVIDEHPRGKVIITIGSDNT